MRNRVIMICGDLCNLGDLALVFQNLEISGATENLIRTWAPLPGDIRDQVAARGGRLLDGKAPWTFLAAMARSDVVIGGGQLIRQNNSTASLLLLSIGLAVCRLSGGKVTTRGLGVSPINRPLYRFLWKRVLATADKVRVRDARSRDHVAKLDSALTVELTTDMAFYPTRLHGALARTSPADTVVIAPCIDAGETRSIDTFAFAMVLDVIRDVLPESKLAIVCHDPRPSMDIRAADEVIAKYKLDDAQKICGYNLDELIAQYNACKLIVTNRLHALIFGLLAGKPVVVIADGSQKTRDMAELFNVPVISSSQRDVVERAIAFASDFDRTERAKMLAKQAIIAERNLTA